MTSVFRSLIGLWLLVVCLAAGGHISAQETNTNRTLTFGDTVSGFLTADETEQDWTFSANGREIVEVILERISGQLSPSMQIFDARGALIPPDETINTRSGQILRYEQAFGDGGEYTLRISGENVRGAAINPDEYSLQLRQQGERLTDIQTGLSIPATGLGISVPDLESGAPLVDETGDARLIDVAFYGNPNVVRPDPGRGPQDYRVSTSNYTIETLWNGSGAQRVTRSVSFTPQGIGIVAQPRDENDTAPPFFFTDQNITRIENTAATITIILADGTRITTDYFGLESIWAIEGQIVANASNGNRLLFDVDYIDLVEERGNLRMGLTPTDTPDDAAQYIISDLQGWQTLAYLPDQSPALHILSGENTRFLFDFTRVTLTQQAVAVREGESPGPTPPPIFNLQLDDDDAPITLTLDTLGMGDIRITGGARGELSIIPLDGRSLTEPLPVLDSVLVQERVVRFAFLPDQASAFRLSFPDGTSVVTPNPGDPNPDASPNQPNYTPSGYNNLGVDYLPVCPCLETRQENTPVNVVNGNFYYPVQDYHVPSHTVNLEFTRHYNSLGGQVTPAYMLDSPRAYLLGQLGTGWRHSHHIELDITFAPLGRVTLIQPDGTRHIFQQSPEDPFIFTSQALPMWRIAQQGGSLGPWMATRTDGLRYAFDAVGRLQRIIGPHDDELTFAPAPRFYLQEGDSGGYFVVEPYGRRLEVYWGADGRITRMRNVDNFEIRYRYDTNGNLIGVAYADTAQQAAYEYNAGQMTALDDDQSPYAAVMSIDYDPTTGQVTRVVDNPGGSPSRERTYTYETLNPGRATIETLLVNGAQRQTRWIIDTSQRVERLELPRESWSFDYEYSLERPTLLATIRQPEGARSAFTYNAQGLLIRLADPVYAATPTTITYAPSSAGDGHQQRIAEITYRSGGYDRFTYDEQDRLATHTRLVLPRRPGQEQIEHVTRYTYDEQSRLIALFQPGPDGEDVETRYTYDDFGYVTRISFGNGARELEFIHDRVGRLSSVTDGRGNTLSLNWSVERNLLLGLNAPLDYTRRFTYDEQNRIIRQEDGSAITEFVYDALGRVTDITDPDGRILSYTYDEADNLRTELRGDGESRYTYTYDALDNLTSVTTPSGLMTTYAVELERGTDNNPTGRLLRSTTDPNGRDSVYIYDPLGRLTEVRFQDVNDRSIRSYNFVYSGTGETLDINRSDFPGRNLSLTYDLLGRPVASRINTSETTYTYDLAGNLRQVEDPSERVTQYTYDVLGNITGVTLPSGATYDYLYDENGNRIAATAPTGATTDYVYDALNRLDTLIDPLGRRTSYSYDINGNLTTITDPRNNIRQATYDNSNRLMTLTDFNDQTTTYNYNDLGNLQEIRAPAGLNTSFTYDDDGNIIAINQPLSRNTLYGYDALGRVTSITDALGHTSIYTYDRLDRLSRLIDPVGNIQEYDWNSNGRLLRLNDPLGRVFEYNLDGLGRLERIRDRNNEIIAVDTLFAYDPAGYVTNVRTGNGQVIGGRNDVNHAYTYTPDGLIDTYTPPNLDPNRDAGWRFEYDDAGRLIAQIAPDGIRTVYTRDTVGQITRITHAADTADEITESFEYDENGNVTTYTAPGELVTTFRYDANNRLTDREIGAEEGQQRTYRYTYNRLGYLTGVLTPDERRTEYQYDVFGNLLGVVRFLPDDESGTELPILDRFTYDFVGNLEALVLPEGFDGTDSEERGDVGEDFRVNLTYNALDHRVRYVDAEDNVWAYTYDRLGNVLEISDPLGSVIRYRYDTVGRVASIEYPTGAVVQFNYDRRDQLNEVRGAETEIRTFGNQERVTEENVVIRYDIDANGNLIGYQDSDGSRTEFEYDAMNNLIRRVDASRQVTRYQYDNLGRLITTSYPNGPTVTRAYNPDGRLTSVSGGGSTFGFDYTLFGELQSSNGPGFNLNYERDINGNLLARDGGNDLGRTEYTYDALERLVRVDFGEHFIEFSYNRNDWLTEIRRSNGVNTSYAYDTNGRTTRITHANPEGGRPLDQFSYDYDSVGNITRITRGDSWNVLYSYDTAHQVINERWLDPNRQTRYFINTRYDQAGNRVETLVQNLDDRTPTRTLYVYDDENQLTQIIVNYVPPDEEASVPPVAFALAVGLGLGALWLGRRRRQALVVGVLCLSLLAPMAAWAFQFGDLDFGTEEQRVQLDYDDNGNLTEIVSPTGDRLRYRYDAENRLISAEGTQPNGPAIDTALRYDPFGRLQEWAGNNAEGRTVRYAFYYDAHELIAIENRNTGGLQRFLSPLPGYGPMLIVNEDGSATWPLHDSLNSVRRLADNNGALILTDDTTRDTPPGYDFNAFGQQIRPYGDERAYAPALHPEPLFTGELYDASTRNYIMGLRHYAPALGRFFQRDPIRHDPQGNLYTYAYNRPGYFIDPQGTTPEIALQATRAYQLPEDLLPEVAPDTILDHIPDPPPMHALQYAESMRALHVSSDLRYGLNESNAQLDPSLADFYIYRVNPMPDTLRQQQGAMVFAMQQPFTPGQGWRQPPAPDINTPPDPLAALSLADPHLRRVMVEPLAWCAPAPPRYLDIPSDPTPRALTTRWQTERDFLPTLRETPLALGIMPSLNRLATDAPRLSQPAPGVPDTQAPEALVNPAVLQRLEALRTQQVRFYQEALLVDGHPPR